MYYSITFVNSSNVKKNTWEDWHLVPTSPPMIETPEPYTNFVEIPGRTEGPIDLSEALSNGPSYQNSDGAWDFILVDEGQPRIDLYQEIKNFLHGRRLKVILEEDYLHYYEGRFSTSMPKTGNGFTQFSIGYEIAPVRYRLDGTKEGI